MIKIYIQPLSSILQLSDMVQSSVIVEYKNKQASNSPNATHMLTHLEMDLG